jgi:plasmid replication initiation protein
MMLAMRCVDQRSSPYQYAKPTEYVKVKVNAADFAEIADLKPDENGYTNRAAYEGLKSACDKLYERSATWTEGNKQHRMRWTWKSTYHEKEGWAEISFSPDLTRHIFMLGERFVRYRLEYARGLRSLYSSTLLRLLMTQKDTGFKTITLEDFRQQMEVPESYKYADIKRYAILKPVAELNEKADMQIEWKETKRGRSVHSLQFTFSFVKKEKAVQGELEL